MLNLVPFGRQFIQKYNILHYKLICSKITNAPNASCRYAGEMFVAAILMPISSSSHVVGLFRRTIPSKYSQAQKALPKRSHVWRYRKPFNWTLSSSIYCAGNCGLIMNEITDRNAMEYHLVIRCLDTSIEFGITCFIFYRIWFYRL